MKNICLFFILIGSLAVVPGCTKNNLPSATNKRKIYLYFSDLKASPEQFSLKGEFYSIDGNKEELDGVYIESNGISHNELKDRLYYFDIADSSVSSKFYLYHYENRFIATELYRIDSSVFILDSQSYNVSENSGFSNLKISSKAFADYFISRLDPNNPDILVDNDYLISLEKDVFNSLTDYSDEYAKNIVWEDQYLQKTVSLFEKWNTIKSNVKKTQTVSSKKKIIKIFSYLSLFALTLVAVIFTYGKHKKKRKIL